MSKSKDTLKRFKFTKRERRGSIILLLILICVMILPKIYHLNQKPLSFEFTEEEIQKRDQLKEKQAKKEKNKQRYNYNKDKSYQKREFKSPLPTEPFDPDTMTIDSWIKLGLSERQADVLISYRTRLEGFYTIDQLYSCYVLDSAKVDSWKPFIVFNKKKPVEKKIEINSANAEELKKLRGIGDKLSERIVAYRQKLGGFVSVDQVGEVYGLSPETFESIKPKLIVDSKKITPISINQIEIKELAAHPYFNYQMAKLIINYRLQHGPYSSMDELLKSKGIEIEDVKKVEPYINFAP